MPTSQTWQMKDAQKMFRQVVKSELDILLSEGWSREEAVKALLHRIVKTSQTPSDDEVEHVMTQFKMNHEDATRALIVKQELGRLKQRGLDPLAAIEELTCKMQRMLPISSSTSTTSTKEELKNKIRMELNHEIREQHLKEDDQPNMNEEDEFDEEDEDEEEDVPHAPTDVDGTASTVFDAVPVSTPKSLVKKATLFTPSLFTKAPTSLPMVGSGPTVAEPSGAILSPSLRTSDLYHSKRKRRHLDLETINGQNLGADNHCHIHRSNSSKKHRSVATLDDGATAKHTRNKVNGVNTALASTNPKRIRSSAMTTTDPTSPTTSAATDASMKRRRI